MSMVSRKGPEFSLEFLPPLEAGDRLSRSEFERRYEATPRLKKAELIEGVVYMPSPVRFRRHSQPHADLITWLGVYRAHTPGVEVGDNSTARLDLDNEPQPDAILLIDPVCGGQVRISEDDYIESAPELVGEIAATSASYDLNVKLHVYRRNGVREYIAWRVLDRHVDWFVLRGDQYEILSADRDGVIRSEVFPGLCLDPVALVQGELARVLIVLQKGLGGSDHAAFAAQLLGRRTSRE